MTSCLALRKKVNAEGLELAALENFDPGHWYDVLLDGPRKQEQLENIKTTIRNMGRAGIPCMGYYFSVAGVWGRTEIQSARGEARGVGFLEVTDTTGNADSKWYRLEYGL